MRRAPEGASRLGKALYILKSFPMTDEDRETYDITALLAWLDVIALRSAQAAQAHEQLRGVVLLPRSKQETLDAVRELMASGVIRWGAPQQMPPNEPAQHLVDLMRQRIVFAALWPLIICPTPPPGWEHALSAISSPGIVILTATIHLQYIDTTFEKDRNRKRSLRLQFAAALSQPQYADGITGLLEDLSDLQYGGAVLNTYIVARDESTKRAEDLPAVLKLLIGGSALGLTEVAVQGVIGNRADAVVLYLWEQLKDIFKPEYAHAQLDTTSSLTYYTIANDHFHKGEFEQAIANYKLAIELNPKFTIAYYEIGLTYRTIGADEIAKEYFNKAINIDPSLTKAYYELGCVFNRQGELSQAITNFNKTIELDMEFFPAYLALGKAYEHSDEWNQAINVYHRSLKLKTDVWEVYFGLGNSYREIDNHNQAIFNFSQVIRLDPNNARAYFELGDVYREDGNYNQAIINFTQSIKIDPNYPGSYLRLGNAYHKIKNYNQAIFYLNQFIKLSPNEPEGYFEISLAYRKKRQYNQAISNLNRVIQLNPNHVEAHHGLGAVYWDKNDKHRAIASFNRGIQINPNFADPYYGLGVVYKYTGEKAKSIMYLRKALSLCKDKDLRKIILKEMR